MLFTDPVFTVKWRVLFTDPVFTVKWRVLFTDPVFIVDDVCHVPEGRKVMRQVPVGKNTSLGDNKYPWVVGR